MKKKILSYTIAITIFIVGYIFVKIFMLSTLKFGFEKVLIFTILLIINILNLKKLANGIYVKLNKKEI